MEKKSGISIQTLIISALAAVAAAVVVPMIWDRGTLFATAMTPVIVAVVSEALRKPAEAISTVAPKVTRRSATGAAVRSPERYEPLPPTETFDPLPPEERNGPPEVRDDDPFGLRAAPKPRHHWKIALATGAVAFVIAAVFLTSSELVFGGAATRDGRTSLFGGNNATPTATASPTATPEQDEEATPTATPTPTPTATATETPAPQNATPTPTVTATPTATP
jgi:hypothetical protein